MLTPHVGAIVHYVPHDSPGQRRTSGFRGSWPAIVTRLVTPPDSVSLTAFPPATPPVPILSSRHGYGPGDWRWPDERGDT